MDNLPKDSEEWLRDRIEYHELENYTEEILKVAREDITIQIAEEIEELKPGQSRIGGAPDLVDFAQWPRYSDENEEGLAVFYLQLNLADIPHFVGNCLPNHGILSVFTNSQILADDGTVLYLSENENLQIQELPTLQDFADQDLSEHNIPACFHTPRRLKFVRCVSIPKSLYCPDCIEFEEIDIYDELYADLSGVDVETKNGGDNIGSMFSHPHQGLPDVDDPEWFSLLILHSESPYFQFGDWGKKAISILKNNASSGNFNDIQFNYCE